MGAGNLGGGGMEGEEGAGATAAATAVSRLASAAAAAATSAVRSAAFSAAMMERITTPEASGDRVGPKPAPPSTPLGLRWWDPAEGDVNRSAGAAAAARVAARSAAVAFAAAALSRRPWSRARTASLVASMAAKISAGDRGRLALGPRWSLKGPTPPTLAAAQSPRPTGGARARAEAAATHAAAAATPAAATPSPSPAVPAASFVTARTPATGPQSGLGWLARAMGAHANLLCPPRWLWPQHQKNLEARQPKRGVEAIRGRKRDTDPLMASKRLTH
jgi:hypothetical protein